MLHIIFRWIVLEAAQILRELVLHYFPVDCFGGSLNLEGTGSTYFPADCVGNLEGTGSTFVLGGLFRRQLRFGGVHNLDLLKRERTYLEVSIGDTREHQLGVYPEIESLCFNIT